MQRPMRGGGAGRGREVLLKKVSLVSDQDPEDEAEGRRRYGATSAERQYKSLTEDDVILRPEAW